MKPTNSLDFIASDIFKGHFLSFIDGAQQKVKSRVPEAEICYTVGPKYIRISVKNYQTYVYCFIDIETGHIWKAKGWASPEKKNPRSCIYDDDYGLSGVNAYGTVYLR